MDDENPYSAPATSVARQAAEKRSAWKQWASLAFAATGSALVWCLSSALTGQVEPWDAAFAYYGLGIAAAAAIGALFVRSRIWIPVAGAYLGQVIYCLAFYHPGGPVILPIAISAAVFGVIPSVIGAFAGASVGRLFHRSRNVDAMQ